VWATSSFRTSRNGGQASGNDGAGAAVDFPRHTVGGSLDPILLETLLDRGER
jgi:hypothetical protein